jgi:hypothetical protein
MARDGRDGWPCPVAPRRRQARIERLREVVATTGIRNESFGADELDQRTGGQRVLCPLDLQVWAVDRMLNFEITDDPHYEGLELQVFDDPVHGRGMIVLLKRSHDGRFDVYRQPGLVLDPAYVQVGGELGEWRQASIEPARFEIGACGIDVDVRLSDLAGRDIRVRIDDRDGRRRHPGTLLAPVGSTIEHPVSLPLFLMSGCDLVRKTGPAFDLRIGGRRVTTGRLPGGWPHRRRLVKYTAAPTAVVLNPAGDGPVDAVDPRTPGNVRFDGMSNRIESLQARTAGHCAGLVLEPAFPDIARLRPDVLATGDWRLAIDDNPAVVGGTWTVERRQDHVHVFLDVTRGWRPRGQPPLMAAVTRVAPVFRKWPTTYCWSATITLGDPPLLSSRWERKSSQRDQSYRRLTTARPR